MPKRPYPLGVAYDFMIISLVEARVPCDEAMLFAFFDENLGAQMQILNILMSESGKLIR